MVIELTKEIEKSQQLNAALAAEIESMQLEIEAKDREIERLSLLVDHLGCGL